MYISCDISTNLQDVTLDLLVHFWETVVGDLAVEFTAAAQGTEVRGYRGQRVQRSWVMYTNPAYSYATCKMKSLWMDSHIMTQINIVYI